ncbi:cytochrome P450 [Noviherbaspirillum sp.]|jgi:cytochrome P450|uniref:cytochrome P450 n=1 Tax=Noviherbaspirillum sp. TaxID=1926288 RepID=UPI0025CD7280|nr:cytochrome P450 [Noviherbaspirillum sp.]
MNIIEEGMGAVPYPILAAPVPPSKPLPIWRFLPMQRDNTLATYFAQAYEQDFIERKLLWTSRCIVNEPNAIKHILLDNAANYPKSVIMRRVLEAGLGRGLITSEGATWRRDRKIMARSFDHRSIAAYSPIIGEICEALLADWDSLPGGAEVDMADSMMYATLHIISRAMFSSGSDEIADVLNAAMQRFQSEARPSLFDFMGFPQWVPRLSSIQNRKVRRHFDNVHKIIERLHDERKRAGDQAEKDLLSRLIMHEGEEAGSSMSPQEVRDQMLTIFAAGHETTAQALTWTWYLLSQHPEVEARLHAELDAVLQGRAPRQEDIGNLPYTRMVIEESMRLYPSVHTITRQALKDDEVQGHRIPAGATIIISPWLLHRKPGLWENPGRFDPERFHPERAACRHRYAYIPFGGGPRICIGASFAMVEAMLIIASVAQRYRLRLKPGHPVEPQGLITVRPRHGMKMLLERRADGNRRNDHGSMEIR